MVLTKCLQMKECIGNSSKMKECIGNGSKMKECIRYCSTNEGMHWFFVSRVKQCIRNCFQNEGIRNYSKMKQCIGKPV